MNKKEGKINGEIDRLKCKILLRFFEYIIRCCNLLLMVKFGDREF